MGVTRLDCPRGGGRLDRLAPLCQTGYRTPDQTAPGTRSNRPAWPESALANFGCQHTCIHCNQINWINQLYMDPRSKKLHTELVNWL
jgi:hypothetical protein